MAGRRQLQGNDLAFQTDGNAKLAFDRFASHHGFKDVSHGKAYKSLFYDSLWKSN
jgi:hypothetical protein